MSLCFAPRVATRVVVGRVVRRSQVERCQGYADGRSPQPLCERSYSGKLNLRVGVQLHRRLAIDAAEEHLSLNQYVVRRLTNAS